MNFVHLRHLKKGDGKPNNVYGFQYWIYTGMPFEVTYFRGMSGQYIISVPEKDLVIVRTGSGTDPNWQNTDEVKDDALGRTLSGATKLHCYWNEFEIAGGCKISREQRIA
jgi:CubicO group peptidase (beta-lactamase class C family)